MNLARRLYELQLIDLEIQGFQQTLDQLNLQIGANDDVVKAKADLDAFKKHLAEVSQKCRDMEWETEDLQKKIAKLSGKLYGGKVANPKELVSMEQELGNFNTDLKRKEDDLLELMNEEEDTKKNLAIQSEKLAKLEQDWQQQQKTLIQKRDEVEKQLQETGKKREEAAGAIGSQTLNLYERLRAKRGQAVARAEQGTCQGCRITLSMNEWQRVKSGTVVVQCSSCGKILYLE